jgi:hypothetical protein
VKERKKKERQIDGWMGRWMNRWIDRRKTSLCKNKI